MFDQPGRYNWLLQYYLRAEGINLSWVGTGRCLFSLDFDSDDYAELSSKLMSAGQKMQRDKWWLTEAEQPGHAQIIKARLIADMTRSLFKMPQPLSKFYAEIMRRKHDDHLASHSDRTNQFLHLISSSMFIFCYFTIFLDLVLAMWVGLLSLLIRQTGHALIEPPCHDKEQLLLGFDTRSKTFVVVGFLIIPAYVCYSAPTLDWLSVSGPIAAKIAHQWFWYTAAVILGRVLWLVGKHGVYNSMVWFVKLITDPITDIKAYYRSAPWPT